MKTCTKCGEEKPLDAFNLDKRYPNRRHAACSLCRASECRAWRTRNIERSRADQRVRSRAWYAANSERKRAYGRAYNRTVAGVATKLREHGIDKPTSEYWAKILTDEDTRCAICGIPLHKLIRLGFWHSGGEPCNRRLSFDHVTPGVNDGNYRALCFSCNTLRKDNHLKMEEVLLIMRGWYRSVGIPVGKLNWLNTHVENGVAVGGTLHRNDHMKRKFDDLRKGDEE